MKLAKGPAQVGLSLPTQALEFIQVDHGLRLCHRQHSTPMGRYGRCGHVSENMHKC